jgi:hypothetical protein
LKGAGQTDGHFGETCPQGVGVPRGGLGNSGTAATRPQTPHPRHPHPQFRS